MALINLSGPVIWPSTPASTGTPQVGTVILDAAGEKLGAIVKVPKAGTISKVGFLTDTVTTGATLDVRLETVNTSGEPSGTLWGTNTNAAQVVSSTDDDTWFLKALTSGAVVSAGDMLAVSIVNPIGGNMRLTRMADFEFHIPNTLHFTTSWSKSNRAPVLAFEYSDGSYAVFDGVYPLSSITQPSYNLNSTPDERGIRFIPTFNCRAVGAALVGLTIGDYRVKLYDSASSLVVQTGVLEGQARASSALILAHVRFTSSAQLNVGEVYRLTLAPQETTASVQLSEVIVNAAALLDSWPGGQAVHGTTRTDGGSWTDSATTRPYMGLLIDQLDDGVTAGGGWFAGE